MSWATDMKNPGLRFLDLAVFECRGNMSAGLEAEVQGFLPAQGFSGQGLVQVGGLGLRHSAPEVRIPQQTRFALILTLNPEVLTVRTHGMARCEPRHCSSAADSVCPRERRRPILTYPGVSSGQSYDEKKIRRSCRPSRILDGNRRNHKRRRSIS